MHCTLNRFGIATCVQRWEMQCTSSLVTFEDLARAIFDDKQGQIVPPLAQLSVLSMPSSFSSLSSSQLNSSSSFSSWLRSIRSSNSASSSSEAKSYNNCDGEYLALRSLTLALRLHKQLRNGEHIAQFAYPYSRSRAGKSVKTFITHSRDIYSKYEHKFHTQFFTHITPRFDQKRLTAPFLFCFNRLAVCAHFEPIQSACAFDI